MLWSCSEKQKNENEFTLKNTNTNYVLNINDPLIGSYDPILIEFTEPFYENQVSESDSIQSLIEVTPSVLGKLTMTDERSFEFMPEKPWERGQQYKITFNQSKSINIADDVSPLTFYVIGKLQKLEHKLLSMFIHSFEHKSYEIIERLKFSDKVLPQTLKQSISLNEAYQDANFELKTINDTNYELIISGVKAKAKEDYLIVKFDNEILKSKQSMSITHTIPSKNSFQLTKVIVDENNRSKITLAFSDLIDTKQDLNGLFEFENNNVSYKYEINKNCIVLFFTVQDKRINEVNFKIPSELKSVSGKSLAITKSVQHYINTVKPNIRLEDNSKTQISTSKGQIIPFEAVGLRFIRVMISEVKKEAIPYFLMHNELNNRYSIKQFAEKIYTARIDLSTKSGFNPDKYLQYYFDLDKVTNMIDGSIYHIQYSFTEEDAYYRCGTSNSKKIQEPELIKYKEEKFWDTFEDYNYNLYDWSQRDNPCHYSYYYANARNISQNLNISNIGLIVKEGEDKSIKVFASDLISTNTLADVDIKILNKYNNIIASGKTDDEGIFSYQFKDQSPARIVANDGKQYAYLNLTYSNALPLGNFNVGGQSIRDSNGYIYGERGIWRPGDDIYLHLIVKEPHDVFESCVFTLIDPKGKLIDEQFIKKPTMGFYTIQTRTSPDDLNGSYTAKFEIGSQSYLKTLVVKSIKPNRLRTTFENIGEQLTANDFPLHINTTTKWLHGADAKNIKLRVKAFLTETKPKIKDFDHWTCYNETENQDQRAIDLFEGQTLENGKATFQIPKNKITSNTGTASILLYAESMEPGGNLSKNFKTINVFTESIFPGIELPSGEEVWMKTGKDLEIKFGLIDHSGDYVSGNNLSVSVDKLSWSWWFNQSNSGHGNYFSDHYLKNILHKEVTTTNGKNTLKFNVPHEEWGRYAITIKDKETNLVARKIIYIDWPDWIDLGVKKYGDSPELLHAKINKKEYNVGEDLLISFQGMEDASILVTVENHQQVSFNKWFKVKAGMNELKVPITSEMAPSAYIGLILIQPHASTANDLPIRTYNYLPFKVQSKQGRLYPKINVPKEITSNATLPVMISETEGKEMFYSLAVVDEGLLDITNFKTPSPYNAFNKKNALGVSTYDAYSNILKAVNARTERILALGGDEDQELNKKKLVAKRFKPIVRVLGPFELKKGETNAHNIQLAEYIGSVKTMVIARKEQAFGDADATTTIKQELMVLGTLPRVLAPTDNIKIPVNTFIGNKKITSVTLEMQSNDLVNIKPNKRNLETANKKEVMNYFDAMVNNKEGVMKLGIHAKSGLLEATQDYEIQVRNPNPMVINNKMIKIQPGKTVTRQIDPFGTYGSNGISLESSLFGRLDITKRLNMLIHFPYGNLEQITSAAFSQLLVKDFVDLTAKQKQSIDENIISSIKKIRKMQLGHGDLSYWSGVEYVQDWASIFAMHFLLTAKSKGYNVPVILISKWMSFQTKLANQFNYNPSKPYNIHIQAYRLYVLALHGKGQLAAMNKLKAKQQFMNAMSLSRLALTYKLVGQENIGEKLVEGLSSLPLKHNYNQYTLGSSIRDKAMVMQALLNLNRIGDAKKIEPQITQRFNEGYMNTQSICFAILAYSDYFGHSKKEDKIQLQYAWNEHQMVDLVSTRTVVNIPFNSNADKKQLVRIKNTGNKTMYLNIIQTGKPAKNLIPSQNKNISMKVKYVDLQGNTVNASKIAHGQTFKVKITITNIGLSGLINDLALNYVIPSGWEIIENENLKKQLKEGVFYQDIRDDRINVFFALNEGQERTFEYTLNASFIGNFFMPVTICKSMYRDDIIANNSGFAVEIE